MEKKNRTVNYGRTHAYSDKEKSALDDIRELKSRQRKVPLFGERVEFHNIAYFRVEEKIGE